MQSSSSHSFSDSTSSSDSQQKWLVQLHAMRAAIAELKSLPHQNGNTEGYGHDIVVDEDDSSHDESSDELWDFITDDEDDQYSSDMLDGADGAGYGQQWLRDRCVEFTSRKSGLDASDLQEQITAILASDSNDGELQMGLADIIGFDDLDFVVEIITHRKELLVPLSEPTKRKDGILGGLQSKKEREEALRQQDYEHKNAALGPSLGRDGPQYPHVYKAHNAGNTLAAGGRKYALPLGSERKEHEVCFSNTQHSPRSTLTAIIEIRRVFDTSNQGWHPWCRPEAHRHQGYGRPLPEDFQGIQNTESNAKPCLSGRIQDE